jgi:GT2 family glycosyltransferase
MGGWPNHPSAASGAAGRRSGGPPPRVSLVTPSYNQARFLEKTLQSVLNQGYSNLEYIVMDGGSTDGSVDILKVYAERLTYWESVPDRGQAEAINKGWRRATGEFVWWLNSDDVLAPGSLEAAVAFLQANPDVHLAYGDHLWIDADGRPVQTYRYPEFDYERFELHRPDVSQAGALMRREVIRRVGYLDEELHFLMDLDYWRRMALAGCRLAHVPRVLAHFRIYDQAKTLAGSPRAVAERCLLNQRLFSSPDLPDVIRTNRARVTSRMHVYCSRTSLLCGDYRSAAREALRAAHAWPQALLGGDVWYHAAAGILGLLVGHRCWRALRSLVRRARAVRVRSTESERA